MHEGALLRYDRSLADDDKNYVAWSDRGYTLEKLGRYAEAGISFSEAITLCPKYAPAWLGRGIVLGQLQEFASALYCFDQALRFAPKDYRAWYNRGKVLISLNRYREAIESFDQAIQFKPEKYQAWYHRATALAERHQYAEALASIETTLAVKKSCYYAWNYRGGLMQKLERYDEAIASYQASLHYRLDNFDAEWGLARCYLLQDDLPLALTALARAFEIHPQRALHRFRSDSLLQTIRQHREVKTLLRHYRNSTRIGLESPSSEGLATDLLSASSASSAPCRSIAPLNLDQVLLSTR